MPFISTQTATFDAAAGAYRFSLAENSPDDSLIGRVVFDGGGPGETYFTVTGPDADKVRMDADGTVRLIRSSDADFEALHSPAGLSINISVLFLGSEGIPQSAEASNSFIEITDVDEAPVLSVTVQHSSIDENTVPDTPIASIVVSDPDGDTTVRSLSGEHASSFFISGPNIYLSGAGGLNFETTGGQIALTVTATSTGISDTPMSQSQTINLQINDVDEPLVWDSSETTFSITENAPTGTVVGRVSATDGDGDAPTYTLAGDHAHLFEIDPQTGVITVRDQASMNYEALATAGGSVVLPIRVDVMAMHDSGIPSLLSRDITISVLDADEAPEIEFTPDGTPLEEHADRDTVVGRVHVADQDGDQVRTFITGSNARLFTFIQDTIVVNRPQELDYETLGDTVDVTLIAISQQTGQPAKFTRKTISIPLINRDEPPTGFRLSTQEAVVSEHVTEGRKLADIVFDDDGVGDNSVTLSDTDLFEVRGGTELWLKQGAQLDYETRTRHQLTVTPQDAGGSAALQPMAFTLVVSDADEKPTVMSLSATQATMGENMRAARKLADISFVDDAIGINNAVVPGSSIFEIRNGTELWLKANAPLDYESATRHQIEVSPDVSGIGDAPTAATFTLSLTDEWDEFAITNVPGTVSQFDHNGMIGRATRISGFNPAEDKLRLHPDVDEIWYRQVGGDQLITAFDTTRGVVKHYVLLEGVSTRLASHNFVDTTTLVKSTSLGTSGDDRYSSKLRGDAGNNHIEGGAGRDHIYGLAGQDIIFGGSGFDIINGGPDKDIIFGGADRDFFGGSDYGPVAEADWIMDWGYGGVRDKIIMSERSNRQAWFKHQDVNADGRMDTIVFDNPHGHTGAILVLMDHGEDLSRQDFWFASGFMGEIA